MRTIDRRLAKLIIRRTNDQLNTGADPSCAPHRKHEPVWSSQDSVEMLIRSFLSCFKLLWAETTQMVVTTGAIVERIDVVGDVFRRQLAVVVDVLLDPLFLQAAKERFGDGVDALCVKNRVTQRRARRRAHDDPEAARGRFLGR